MNIRPATQDDVQDIFNIVVLSISTTHSKIFPNKDMKEALDNYTKDKILEYIEKYKYFVCEDGEKTIGCVMLRENVMRSLYILPEYMGKGVGKLLVKFAEKEVLASGFGELKLNASVVSLDFYKHLGYSIIEELPNEQGQVLHYKMMRLLG